MTRGQAWRSLARLVVVLLATLWLGLSSCGGTADVAPSPSVLVSLAILPAEATVPAGKTVQLGAEATAADGSKSGMTTTVVWSSSDPAVATVDSLGRATGVTPGTTTITATLGALTAASRLTVVARKLTSVRVTPPTASVRVGSKQAFAATGTYDDSTTGDLTSIATWSSSDAAVATVDAKGSATGVAIGSATISATVGGSKGTALLDVTAVPITSIVVTPLTAKIAVGDSQAFTATASYSDETTKDVTATAAWSSDRVDVATVGATTGLATGVGVGVATLTATLGGKSGSAKLTVVCNTLKSLVVSAPATIPVGGEETILVEATCTDCKTDYPCSAPSLSWVIADTTVISIGSGNRITGLKVGTTTFFASGGPAPPKVFTITVTP